MPDVPKASRRLKKASERLDALAKKYEAEGLEPEKAKDRATKEMRDNGRKDWRAG